MEFQVFICAQCRTLSTSFHVLKKHVETTKQCKGATIAERIGTVPDPPDREAAPTPVARIKPGPKPFDPLPMLQGCLPAFSDEGEAIEARIDHTFDSQVRGVPLVDYLLFECSRGVTHPRILHFFKHLWGDNAPPNFKSVRKARGHLYEVTRLDETGAPADVRCDLVKIERVRELIDNVMEFIETVCEVSVPARRPDLQPRAYAMHRYLTSKTHGSSLRDAITQSAEWERSKTKLVDQTRHAREIVAMFMNYFR